MSFQLIPWMRECTNPACCFRYPIPTPQEDRPRCPLCQAETRVVASGNVSRPQGMPPRLSTTPWPVDVLVDNIRSTHNVGSILRTADGAGIRHVHLVGITPRPDNPKVAKTALGAEESVPWTYHRNGLRAMRKIQSQGSHVWALDVFHTGTLLTEAVSRMPRCASRSPRPILLVVGNEIAGIDPDIVAEADKLVTIPMHGGKHSLNVSVAFGVAAYFLTQNE